MAALPRCSLMFAAWLLGMSGSPACASGPEQPFAAAFPSFYVWPEHGVAPVALDDGSTLWMGREQAQANSGSGSAAVVRIRANGTPDSSFGSGGIVRLPAFGASDWPRQILAGSDGHIIAAVLTLDPTIARWCYAAFCPHYLALSRLDTHGNHDASFSGDGKVVIRLGPPIRAGDEENGPVAQARMVAGADGSIALVREGASDATLPLALVSPSGVVRSGSAEAREVAHTVVAAVFYHPELDQYFETAFASELAMLPSLGWISWLGEGFHVDPPGADAQGSVPVCRYYRNPARDLGPGGTPGAHFQSAIAEECAWLAAHPDDWILESQEVYRVALPDAETGTCGPGRIPVYRLWNGRGDGGHVLTTSIEHRSQFIAREPPYVPEGFGPLGVAMCAKPAFEAPL